VTTQKPTIRILRHLARSGGTLISRCLGAMHGVTLLSEVHPEVRTPTNPVAQARDWHGLVTRAESIAWSLFGFPGAPEFVTRCAERAVQRGETLVLREWSHIDYIGVPGVPPRMHGALGQDLRERFRVVETCTVRDPIDQWVSLNELPIIEDLTIDGYLAGCVAFAREAARTGFVRYESFTHDPDAHLRTLCDRLEIRFDPGYTERWPSYTAITGDTVEGLGRSVGRKEIKPLAPRPANPEVRRAFEARDAYHEYCDLLGYPIGRGVCL